MAKKSVAQMPAPAVTEKKPVQSVSAEDWKSPHSVWTGMMTFGLISVPVKLHSGARADRVSFNMLHRDCLNRVKQNGYRCPTCEVSVATDDIVKGYEYRKDNYVVVEKSELEAIAPDSSKNVEIQAFCKVEEIDPLLFESSYYITPAEGGWKAYGLLRKAMDASGYVGVSRVSMHGREHLVVVRPFGELLTLHTLYYESEVNLISLPGLPTANDAEVKVARQLIEALAVPFEHKQYEDTYQTNVKALIKARLEGKEIVTAPKKPAASAPVDIMEAMQASIAAAKAKKKAA